MKGNIDSKPVKNIIKKLAKKYNRSEEDIREMVMWQFKILVEKIRETDINNNKWFTLEMPLFGTFKIKNKLKYKILKYGYREDITKDISSGRSK